LGHQHQAFNFEPAAKHLSGLGGAKWELHSRARVADMRNEAVYSVTKHALKAFLRSLRRQVAPDGLRVTSILPGTVATRLWGINEQSEVDKKVQELEMFSAEDIADVAEFVLTKPANVTIRELVVLPHAQDI